MAAPPWHIDDIPSKLAVVKTANPTSVQEGTQPITFTITITNVLTFTQDGTTYTAVDDITVTSLQDDKLGDLDAAGDVICKVGGVTKAWPITIEPGQSIVCNVTRNVTGTPSTPHTNIATATGFDSDHPNGCAESNVEPFCKTASGTATVTFTPTPPPPYVPTSDMTVTKAATPAVQLPQGGGTAPITYNLVVKNNGPDAGGERQGVRRGTGGRVVRVGDDGDGLVHDVGQGSGLHDLEPGVGRVGADHDQRDGQRDGDEDERRRDHHDDAVRDQPEQQHGLRLDGRHRTGDAAEAAGRRAGDLRDARP